MKWYGSLDNRLEENNDKVSIIEVGTGMTEYSYSDRHPYEVVEVKDQKHVTVRGLRHRLIGEPMSNNWELYSDNTNPTMDMVKRGNYWYRAVTATAEMLNGDIETRLWLATNGFNPDTLKTKGKQTKYFKMNVSFGVAEYYYDYEF